MINKYDKLIAVFADRLLMYAVPVININVVVFVCRSDLDREFYPCDAKDNLMTH